jgi:hypothetical protein
MLGLSSSEIVLHGWPILAVRSGGSPDDERPPADVLLPLPRAAAKEADADFTIESARSGSLTGGA